MALRDELEETMRQQIPPTPDLQRAYLEGNTAGLSPEQASFLMQQALAGIREALYRLADEIDGLQKGGKK